MTFEIFPSREEGHISEVRKNTPGNFLFAGKHFETPKGNLPASAKSRVHGARCSAFRALQTTCKMNAHETDTQCAA